MYLATLFPKANNKHLPFYFLFFTNITYLFFTLYVAYYNRLALDDYYFKALLVKYGFWESVYQNYINWQGRVGMQLIMNIILSLQAKIHALFLYHLALVFIFIYSIFTILKHLLSRLWQKSNFYLFILSLLIFNTFLLTVYDFRAFYWLSASLVYFNAIAFALLGISALLSPSQSMFSYLIIFCGLSVGGSSAENFSFMLTLLLGLLIIIKFLNFKYLKNKEIENFLYLNSSKLIFTFVICLIAFLVMVLAEGNQVRKNAFPDMSILYALFRSTKYVYYTILALVAQKSIFLLVLCLSVIYIGSLCRIAQGEKYHQPDEGMVVKVLVYASVLFVIFLIICVFPNVYALGGIGEYRSLTPIAFYVVIFFSSISFLIGYKTLFPTKIARILTIFGAVTFLIMSNDLRINLYYTKQYVKSEDERMAHLLRLKKEGFQGTVTLKPLFHTPYNLFIMNEIDGSRKFISRFICESMQAEFSLELELKKE
jgi:hypothetical protein